MITMTRQQKGSIVFYSIIILYIAMAVLEVVFNHTYGVLITLGFFVVLYVLSSLLNRGTPDFKKMMESLPADHKLVTGNMAAIDIGNFRFLYRGYVKSMGPAPKSYVLMEVGIPFPEEEVDKDGYSARESIKGELQNLIDNLLEEGILTDYSPIVQEDTGSEDEEAPKTVWLGQIMNLEFLLKSLSAEKLTDIQGKMLGIIDKYRLQDVSWCVMCGRDYGAEYLYYKGNLLQSSVYLKDAFDSTRSDYKSIASLCISEFEHPFSVAGYLELYALARKNLGKQELHLGDVKKWTKMMFKGKKRMQVRIEEDPDELTVHLSAEKAASTYHLIHSEDRWWVYAHGRLDRIPPISVDDESSACDVLLRYLQQQAV